MAESPIPDQSSAAQLFAAIGSGDQEQVQKLIADQPELVDATNAAGVSAVLTALYSGQHAIARLLTTSGATLDIFGATALGEHAAVQRLLEADPALANARSGDGWTPLHLAAFFGHNQVADLLLAHDADVHARSANQMQNLPIHAAAPSANHQLIAKLLDRGADVNARQEGGWTALHEAALIGSVPLATLLLERGADPTLQNDTGQRPLHLAHEKGHTEVVQLLEQRASPA